MLRTGQPPVECLLYFLIYQGRHRPATGEKTKVTADLAGWPSRWTCPGIPRYVVPTLVMAEPMQIGLTGGTLGEGIVSVGSVPCRSEFLDLVVTDTDR